MNHGRITRSRNMVMIGFVVLIVIGAIVATMVVERLESQFGLRVDLTDTQVYSISDTTRDLLEDLDKDITIYTLYASGSQDYTISELLRRYEQSSSHIRVTNIDPVAQPMFTDQYKDDDSTEIENSSLIVVETGTDNYRVIHADNLYEWSLKGEQLYATGMVAEQRITSAISSIMGGTQPTAYFVTGHGEFDTTKQYYLSSVLESDGYLVESYDIVYNTKELKPTDCLLFLQPTSDLTDEEYKIVSSFLSNGGKAMFLLGPTSENVENYNKLLSEFGLSVEETFILETDANNYLTSPLMIRPEMEESSPLLASVIESGVGLGLPRCRSIKVSSAPGVTIDAFIKSSASSYGKTDPYTETLEKEEVDVDGPFVLGAAAENSNTGAKIVLLGNSDFVASLENAQYQGNIALFMDSISWVAEKTDSVVVSPKSLTMAPLKIQSTAASYRLMVVVILVIPAIVVAIGVFVWRKRLRR